MKADLLQKFEDDLDELKNLVESVKGNVDGLPCGKIDRETGECEFDWSDIENDVDDFETAVNEIETKVEEIKEMDGIDFETAVKEIEILFFKGYEMFKAIDKEFPNGDCDENPWLDI